MSFVFALVLAAAPQDFTFGFTNVTGTEVLGLEQLERPERFTRASCDGTVLEAKFIKLQPKGPSDTGRQISLKFDQVAGPRFALSKGKATDNVMCLLGTEAYFAERTFAGVARSEPAACDAGAKGKMEKIASRKSESCVATLSSTAGQLYFARFARKGADVLAGVTLIDRAGAASSRLFPAKYEKDAPSCWRADDGCEFDVDAYQVLFTMSGKAGVELFATWGGAEGETVEVLSVQGRTLKPVATASRYWSPE